MAAFISTTIDECDMSHAVDADAGMVAASATCAKTLTTVNFDRLRNPFLREFLRRGMDK